MQDREREPKVGFQLHREALNNLSEVNVMREESNKSPISAKSSEMKLPPHNDDIDNQERGSLGSSS